MISMCILEHFPAIVKKCTAEIQKIYGLDINLVPAAAAKKAGESPGLYSALSFLRLISVPFSSAPIISIIALIFSQTSSTITAPMEP